MVGSLLARAAQPGETPEIEVARQGRLVPRQDIPAASNRRAPSQEEAGCVDISRALVDSLELPAHFHAATIESGRIDCSERQR